jgi:MFS family permease
VEVLHLRPGQVGAGLSVAGICGFAVTVHAGRAADRLGGRRLLAVAFAALALLYGVYGLVDGFFSFLVVACLVAAFDCAVTPILVSLTYGLYPDSSANQVRAQMRTASNVGFVLGGALAALAVAQGSRAAFTGVALVSTAAHLVCCLITIRLPDRRAESRAGRARVPVLRDLRFVLLAGVNGLLGLDQAVLTVGLPMWIITNAAAPRALMPMLLVINTLLVVVFQVMVTSRTTTVAAAARFQRHAGLLLGAGCVLFAASSGAWPEMACLLLATGTGVLAFGEMAYIASGYTLTSSFAPPGQRGEYQGMFSLNRGIRQAVGPALITTLLIGLGGAGWLVLGAVLAAAGVCGSYLARGPGWSAPM